MLLLEVHDSGLWYRAVKNEQNFSKFVSINMRQKKILTSNASDKIDIMILPANHLFVIPRKAEEDKAAANGPLVKVLVGLEHKVS